MKPVSSVFQWFFLAWRGRLAALLMLAGVTVASLGSELDLPAAWQGSVMARLLSLAGTPFAAARQALFDGYQQALPRTTSSQPVTLVEIDEDSLKSVGQWPWPRNRLAELIDKIAVHQPLAIGLDLYMPELDQTSPDQVARHLPSGHEALAQALQQLGSHEARLVQSLKAAPTAALPDHHHRRHRAGLHALFWRVHAGAL